MRTYKSDNAFITEQFEKENFYRHKAQDEKKYSLVISGDSRALYGLDPITVSKNLNLESAKNFAFLSNSYTPAYLSYLSNRLDERSMAIIPISYESMTSLEEDRSFQLAKLNRSSIFKYFSQLLQYSWPSKGNRSSSYGKENYKVTGEIDRLKSERAQTISLENHYFNIMKNFKIEPKYVLALQELVQNRENVSFYFFHICFLENVCKQEQRLLNSFFELIKKYPNVTILMPQKHFISSDGDHLDQESQIEFSKYLAELIKNQK